MSKHLAGASMCLLILFLNGCVGVNDKTRPKVDKRQVLQTNVRLGMAYLQKDQRDAALRAFAKALELDKRSAEAHQGMAMIHQVNGEFDLAEKSYKRALKGRSDFSRADIEYTYSVFLLEQNRCEEALPLLEKAGNDITYRRRANALFNLGACSETLGNEARALASYQRALNINNRFAPAALELAHKKFTAKEYSEAKRYLDMYSTSARQSPRSLWLGIRIERIFGNKDKEASYALALKNLHPYSREYLAYKQLLESEK